MPCPPAGKTSWPLVAMSARSGCDKPPPDAEPPEPPLGQAYPPPEEDDVLSATPPRRGAATAIAVSGPTQRLPDIRVLPSLHLPMAARVSTTPAAPVKAARPSAVEAPARIGVRAA